jgi:hypothetical protein
MTQVNARVILRDGSGDLPAKELIVIFYQDLLHLW